MPNCFLGLGTNEGDRWQNLKNASVEISKICGKIVKSSSIYETASWGNLGQPPYLNQVLEIETEMSPLELLNAIQKIEVFLGRVRNVKWGNRTLDIDIILYDDLVVEIPDLTIPHPHLQHRKFVLEPLNEIAKDQQHPKLKKSIEILMNECTDRLDVVLATKTDIIQDNIEAPQQ